MGIQYPQRQSLSWNRAQITVVSETHPNKAYPRGHYDNHKKMSKTLISPTHWPWRYNSIALRNWQILLQHEGEMELHQDIKYSSTRAGREKSQVTWPSWWLHHLSIWPHGRDLYRPNCLIRYAEDTTSRPTCPIRYAEDTIYMTPAWNPNMLNWYRRRMETSHLHTTSMGWCKTKYCHPGSHHWGYFTLVPYL